jgi:hypothetical protein
MPSVAFSEGYGNGVSGMVFNDPVYRDTSGSQQANGFSMDVSAAPTGNDKGVYSEDAVQYFLWSLYENRDATPHSGSFDRLFKVLHDDQAVTEALTSVHSFAVSYKGRFGSTAESFENLWAVQLQNPFNSLCSGACGTADDVSDLFDVDNDLGTFYAAVDEYPPGTSTVHDADFWRLYRPLVSGINTHNGHDVISGYGDYPLNKWGVVRAYSLAGTGSTITVTATLLGAQPDTCNNAGDILDGYVLHAGAIVAKDDGSDGCPSMTFSSEAGKTYVVLIAGVSEDVSGWDMVVSP